MCPDPRLLSIYIDGELPSPWKEKLQDHFAQCPACKEKVEKFRQLHAIFEKDKSENRAFTEIPGQAKMRVWENFETRQGFKPRQNVWRRRLSIPLPAAAAAALIILLLAVFWLRIGSDHPESADKSNFILASEMERIEEVPGIIPAADISGVLQYLNPAGSGTNIIILHLPENQSFFRAGEPEIIRAADFTRR